MTEESPAINRIDLKILNVLQIDGRISNLKLAESVALSPTAVLARVEAVETSSFRVNVNGMRPLISQDQHVNSARTQPRQAR